MLNNVHSTLQAFAVLLKEVHAPNMIDLVFKKNVFSSMVGKNNNGITFENEKIFIPVETAAHGGVGFTGGAYIPTGDMSFDRTEATAKYGYGSHILKDIQVENIMKGGDAALIDIADKYAKGLQDSFGGTFNRMLLSNGDGVVTKFTAAASSSQTHTVANTLRLIPGKSYVVGTLAQVKAGTATTVKVLALPGVPNTVKFVSPITVAVGDVIVTEGAYIGTACQEYDGIGNLIDNESNAAGSSFQGKLRADNYWANSYVGGNGSLSEAMLLNLVMELTKYGDPNLLITHPYLQKAYASIVQSNRTNASDVKYKTLESGFVGIEIVYGNKSVPLVADWDCDTKTLFGLTMDTWSHAELSPLDWYTGASGQVFTDVYETVSGTTRRVPASQATMKAYGNLVCTNALANGKLVNVNY